MLRLQLTVARQVQIERTLRVAVDGVHTVVRLHAKQDAREVAETFCGRHGIADEESIQLLADNLRALRSASTPVTARPASPTSPTVSTQPQRESNRSDLLVPAPPGVRDEKRNAKTSLASAGAGEPQCREESRPRRADADLLESGSSAVEGEVFVSHDDRAGAGVTYQDEQEGFGANHKDRVFVTRMINILVPRLVHTVMKLRISSRCCC